VQNGFGNIEMKVLIITEKRDPCESQPGSPEALWTSRCELLEIVVVQEVESGLYRVDRTIVARA
jgi:hypothetical protein